MQDQEKEKSKDNEVTDNIEEFGLKVPSVDEQKKILEEIQREESIDLLAVQRKEEDAVYLEDEPEKALEKLLTLSQYSVQERTAYIKHLNELIQMIGLDKMDRFPAILEQILSDSDEAKKQLINQLNQLILYFQSFDGGIDYIKSYILPPLLQLLKNNNFDIQAESTQLIAQIAGIVEAQERDEHIVKELIMMSHDEQNEQNKIVALQFFGATAKVLGRQCVESFVALEIISAAEDERVRIKKEAIFQTPFIAKEVSQEYFVSKILPFFISKCQEKSWHIRKACAENISAMSEISPIMKREKELTDCMIALLKDNQKWVKAAAFSNLGQFISTLSEAKKKNDILLKEFCRSNSKEVLDYFDADFEIMEKTSYYFLRVLQVYGVDYWPSLYKLLLQLYKWNNPVVRKPIACSFHEIAKVVGPEIAERDLITVLDQMLQKEQVDVIKYGAIQNLFEFIKIFSTDRRENLLDVFLLIQKDYKKWRIRKLIAKQIDKLVHLYNSETIFQIIVPISLKLCNDIVASVRKTAAKQMFSLLQSFNKDDEFDYAYFQCLTENIKAFGVSNRFNQRQAFVFMCQNLLNLKEFETIFLEQFATLCHDPVRNVRICVAEVIKKHQQLKGQFSEHPVILRMIKYFEDDKDTEVRNIIQK